MLPELTCAKVFTFGDGAGGVPGGLGEVEQAGGPARLTPSAPGFLFFFPDCKAHPAPVYPPQARSASRSYQWTSIHLWCASQSQLQLLLHNFNLVNAVT